jgi:anaerobic selenocysteine-containing dehydrogenase
MRHELHPQARTLTRRTLLRNGAAATAAAMLGASAWSSAAAASAGHLRRSSYAGLVGQSFRAGSVELRLLSVSDVAGAKSVKSLAGSENAFVLTFSGPRDAPLEAGTHSFRHRRLGKFELFVSQVGRPGTDRRYEAVVDRSVAASRSPAA